MYKCYYKTVVDYPVNKCITDGGPSCITDGGPSCMTDGGPTCRTLRDYPVYSCCSFTFLITISDLQ